MCTFEPFVLKIFSIGNNMQKITPYLWFDNQAEEVVNFYLSAFPNGKILNTSRYNEASAQASGRPAGTVMTIIFDLNGYKFMALNGGPLFKFNPSVSFILNFDPSTDTKAKENLNKLWEKLSPAGLVRMPLDRYPFSERYGWIEDKYGVSWQLMLTNPDGEERPFIIPSIIFTNEVSGKAEEATDHYLSIFKDSRRGLTARYPKGMEPEKEGTIMFSDFMLEKQWFAAMDSVREHKFAFNEAISFMVSCDNQKEIDHFWDKLSAVPQAEQCGWLKDKYGLSWQIVPSALGELMSTDPDKSKRVMQALLQMKKIDIEALKKHSKEN